MAILHSASCNGIAQCLTIALERLFWPRNRFCKQLFWNLISNKFEICWNNHCFSFISLAAQILKKMTIPRHQIKVPLTKALFSQQISIGQFFINEIIKNRIILLWFWMIWAGLFLSKMALNCDKIGCVNNPSGSKFDRLDPQFSLLFGWVIGRCC
jgi:hypothetical protein